MPDNSSLYVPGAFAAAVPTLELRVSKAKIKDKERIFKAAREKHLVTFKGALKRLSADFSIETLTA